jgi:iron complex outermembrane recepter protein
MFDLRPLTLSCVLLTLLAAVAHAQPDPGDLKKLAIEQLMEIDVTLPTRRAESVRITAAAVTVITRDDIRRAGVTTIADALQLAEGVHVARLSNSSWSISARGFNGTTPNKLLVMIDGRTEFSPLFAGVFWNMLDYLLEDLERIEVIRGPGATLWGSNAVNGVVNIITRHTRDTQGTYASLAVGNEDPLIAQVRHGGAWGTNRTWRVYSKFASRDEQMLSTGVPAQDERRRGQVGFRVDGENGANTWLVKGDTFHSRDGFFGRDDSEWTEIAVQGRWQRRLAPESEIAVQSYYRREYRNVDRQLTHHLDTVDVDFQHAARVAGRHQVIWGGGFRHNHDRTYGSAGVFFDPVARTHLVFSLFAQDEFTLVPDRLNLTAGLKLEHNAFSGNEVQPNVRARLILPHRQVLWGAVARATRRPTRFDDDVVVAAPTGVVLARGSDDFVAESLIATEIGHRYQPRSFLSTEVTAFVHRYDDLRSQEAPVGALFPTLLANTLEGRSHGVELAFNVQPVPWWRTHVGYTWLDTEITREPGSRDVSSGVNEGNDPASMFGLQTSLDLGADVSVDARLRAVDDLPNPVVPAYVELAMRVGWRMTRRIELAIVGEDLLHDQHPEFGSPSPQRTEYERSVRAVITLRLP